MMANYLLLQLQQEPQQQQQLVESKKIAENEFWAAPIGHGPGRCQQCAVPYCNISWCKQT